MSKNPAIEIRNLTKDYKLTGLSQAGGIKNFILHFPSHLKSVLGGDSYRALEDLSLVVERGECVSIIGKNGSGKSTLLGLIAGVLKPTHGTVEARGRIAPLLELGAGFHRDLTGKENIILNGILLGMTREEVQDRLNDIIAFAELGDFIDRPLRVYSSGMVMRLGFAVAVHTSPDILLIDEVLAVGDADFQEKCLEKMNQFRQQGVTMIFVSHDLHEVVRVSDRVVLLHEGSVAEMGDPPPVVDHYKTHFYEE